jgi:hypothetical protein
VIIVALNLYSNAIVRKNHVKRRDGTSLLSSSRFSGLLLGLLYIHPSNNISLLFSLICAHKLSSNFSLNFISSDFGILTSQKTNIYHIWIQKPTTKLRNTTIFLWMLKPYRRLKRNIDVGLDTEKLGTKKVPGIRQNFFLICCRFPFFPFFWLNF